MRNIKSDGQIVGKAPKHYSYWEEFHKSCTTEFRKRRAKNRIRNKTANESRRRNRSSSH